MYVYIYPLVFGVGDACAKMKLKNIFDINDIYFQVIFLSS